MAPRLSPTFKILVAALCLPLVFAATGCTANFKKARHLSRAENYYAAGDYEKAKIEYLNVLHFDGQNLIAIQRLGVIWYEQGAPLKAFPYLLGSRELAPDDVAVRTKLGQAYLSVGEVAEARKEALAILQKDPRHTEAAMLLADTDGSQDDVTATEQVLQGLPSRDDVFMLQARATLAVQHNSLAAAQGLLEQAQAADPKSSSVHTGLAMLAAFNKDTDKAGQELKSAVTLAPARSAARVKYADFKVKIGAVKEAKDFLSETTRRAPDYLPAWQMLAFIASSEKDYDGSQSMLKHIFDADPDNLDARLLEAENWIAKGEPKKAVESLERLDRIYPDLPLIKLRLARAYVQDNNRAQAIVVLTQAVTLSPNYADAILLLSELNISVGQAQTATDTLTTLLKKRPDQPEGRMLLANAYAALGRLDDAVALLHGLAKDLPQNSQVPLLLGTVLRQQNKVADARASFAEAQKLAPGDLDILARSIDLDIQQKDYDSAHAKIRAQLQKTPGSAPTQLLEARVYASQKDWEHTEAILLKALKIDPNFSAAEDLLISTYVSTDKLDLALAQLDDVLSKNPNDAHALIMSARIYSKQKNVEKARASYEKLLASNPNSVEALNDLAYLYSENLNQLDKAYDLSRRARGLAADNASVADTMSWILYRRADYAQALRLAREAVAKLPGEAEVQYHLAMASYMMGQEDTARAAFQRAAESPTDFPGKAEISTRLLVLGGAGPTPTTADLEAVVQRDPADPVAMLRLADAYEKQQAWDKARDTYQRALGVNAQLLRASERLARLYAGPLGDPAKASGYAKTARDLAPNDPQIGALFGQLTYQSGNFVQAYGLLRDSVRVLPDDLGVRRDFALAAYHLGHVEEAREIMRGIVTAGGGKDARPKQDAERFLTLTTPDHSPQSFAVLESEARQVLQADPDAVPALMIQAVVQARHGETKRAADTYAAILQRAPDFTPAQTQLAALCLLDPETRDRAYDLAVKARKSAPNDPEAAQILAAANYYRKEYSYAIQLLQQSARQRPLAAEPLYYLGMCYLQTKQSTQAHDTLTKALAAGLAEPLASEAKRAMTTDAPSK